MSRAELGEFVREESAVLVSGVRQIGVRREGAGYAATPGEQSELPRHLC